jgi:hypothetical protein
MENSLRDCFAEFALGAGVMGIGQQYAGILLVLSQHSNVRQGE